jgi:hypothetical protein
MDTNETGGLQALRQVQNLCAADLTQNVGERGGFSRRV